MAPIRRIGKLKHRIELQSQPVEYDNLGRQVRGEWSTVAKLWAEVRGIGATEVERARQISAQATHIVLIRFRAGVTSEQRILFRGQVLEIKGVLDDDNSRWQLTLVCGEKVK